MTAIFTGAPYFVNSIFQAKALYCPPGAGVNRALMSSRPDEVQRYFGEY
jgi:hypothetical protein